MHKPSNTLSNCHLVPTWFHLVPPRQMHKPSHTLSHFHLVPAWFQFVSFHPSEQTVQYSLAVSLGSALVPLGSALSNAQTVHYSLAFPPASAFVPLGSNLSHFFRLSKPSNTLSLFHLVPLWFHLVPLLRAPPAEHLHAYCPRLRTACIRASNTPGACNWLGAGPVLGAGCWVLGIPKTKEDTDWGVLLYPFYPNPPSDPHGANFNHHSPPTESDRGGLLVKIVSSAVFGCAWLCLAFVTSYALGRFSKPSC